LGGGREVGRLEEEVGEPRKILGSNKGEKKKKGKRKKRPRKKMRARGKKKACENKRPRKKKLLTK